MNWLIFERCLSNIAEFWLTAKVSTFVITLNTSGQTWITAPIPHSPALPTPTPNPERTERGKLSHVELSHLKKTVVPRPCSTYASRLRRVPVRGNIYFCLHSHSTHLLSNNLLSTFYVSGTRWDCSTRHRISAFMGFLIWRRRCGRYYQMCIKYRVANPERKAVQ